MIFRGVYNPKVNPLIFKQPLDEIQIALAKLHTVLSGFIVKAQIEIEIRGLLRLEYLPNNLRNG
ncbi:hypothetical protein SAMN06265784_12039 [Paraburkholderia susongensis]|uniref:Uncharacterized protein n=1 Tax=Paraburkholderia susongensis TaxID=1515439 RepID=A0A1X7M4U8_9BURK|nr:hypothetical protein SAMN06265784_12039 [Paraburkholderia susongensis]